MDENFKEQKSDIPLSYTKEFRRLTIAHRIIKLLKQRHYIFIHVKHIYKEKKHDVNIMEINVYAGYLMSRIFKDTRVRTYVLSES